jgi:hypothetical protein
MSWIDILGFAAAFSVLSSFCMTTIVALRSFALMSNVLFILMSFCFQPIWSSFTGSWPSPALPMISVHTVSASTPPASLARIMAAARD